MQKKYGLLLLIIFSLFLTMACTNNKNTTRVHTKNKGDLAPQFTLFDRDENPVSLETYKGKKVYVLFWASWCTTCLADLKDVHALSVEEKDFEVITIVSPRYDGEMKKEDFIAWFDSLDFNDMTVLFDDSGLWANEFNVKTYPTSYLIGTDGVLVKTMTGNQFIESIKEEMESIY